jgi:hypothetical protein
MNNLNFIKRTFVFVLLLAFISCAHIRTTNEEKMLTLASALTKLSAAVESTVRYKNPPPGLSDEELLALATQHDPTLLQQFADYTVRIYQENRHSIVLICTKDGDRALLEDTNCTPEVDRHHWEETPPKPCEFTLSVPAVCRDQ